MLFQTHVKKASNGFVSVLLQHAAELRGRSEDRSKDFRVTLAKPLAYIRLRDHLHQAFEIPRDAL
jgi:hypothetical protein